MKPLTECQAFMIDKIDGGFVPKAIKWFTGAPYHHAGVFAKRKEDGNRLWVYEAVAKGFVPTHTVEEWEEMVGVKFNAVVFSPEVDMATFYSRLHELHGAPYDFGSLIFWQSIHQLLKRIGLDVWLGRKGPKAKNSIYCTEGVAYILGYEQWWAYDPMRLYTRLKWSKG